MKHIARLSLILAAVAAAPGCIILEGGDDNTTTDVNITWQVMTNNAPGLCPAGFTTARVFLRPAGTAGEADTKADANCSDGTVTVIDVPRGPYEVYIKLINSTGTLEYAESAPVSIDLTSQDIDPLIHIHTDRGMFLLSWSLQHATTNAPVACSSVRGLGGMGLWAANVATDYSNKDKFACDYMSAYSQAYPAGVYNVLVDLVDTAGTAMYMPLDKKNMPVNAPNKITNLGSLVVLVEAPDVL